MAALAGALLRPEVEQGADAQDVGSADVATSTRQGCHATCTAARPSCSSQASPQRGQVGPTWAKALQGHRPPPQPPDTSRRSPGGCQGSARRQPADARSLRPRRPRARRSGPAPAPLGSISVTIAAPDGLDQVDGQAGAVLRRRRVQAASLHRPDQCGKSPTSRWAKGWRGKTRTPPRRPDAVPAIMVLDLADPSPRAFRPCRPRPAAARRPVGVIGQLAHLEDQDPPAGSTRSTPMGSWWCRAASAGRRRRVHHRMRWAPAGRRRSEPVGGTGEHGHAPDRKVEAPLTWRSMAARSTRHRATSARGAAAGGRVPARTRPAEAAAVDVE
jgi:hypothetical protein